MQGKKGLSGFLLENKASLPPHTHTFSKPGSGPTPKRSPFLRTALKTQCCLRVCKNNSFHF